MTSENLWVEAKDLIINKTRIKKSITFPKTNFNDYISDYSIDFGTLNLNMNNQKEIKRFSIFCRLFGMIYTDGSIDKNRANIFTGDINDANSIINDIEFICNVKTKYKFIENDKTKYYHISLIYFFRLLYIKTRLIFMIPSKKQIRNK